MTKAIYKKIERWKLYCDEQWQLALACSHGSLADRASVLPEKPLLDAVCMVAVTTLQLSHIIIHFIFFL